MASAAGSRTAAAGRLAGAFTGAPGCAVSAIMAGAIACITYNVLAASSAHITGSGLATVCLNGIGGGEHTIGDSHRRDQAVGHHHRLSLRQVTSCRLCIAGKNPPRMHSYNSDMRIAGKNHRHDYCRAAGGMRWNTSEK